MAISPGSRIGQYEVRAQLGAGGMGEVYRAHDARLGRDVALEVLHADVARDTLRLERFTREARAVAALNHRPSSPSTPPRKPTASPSSRWSWWRAVRSTS